MEFVDGVNLAQLMKSGRISPREALAIVPQICHALQFAHDQGIVHRDIKPENILLDRLARVKVADFGIAKLSSFVVPPSGGSEDKDHLKVGLQTDPLLTEAGKVMGTPQYMAPEQSDDPADVDHRADIFALGVVFYQMLTGELPGKEMQAPSRKVSIDVRLDEIVMQAMDWNPPPLRCHIRRRLSAECLSADGGCFSSCCHSDSLSDWQRVRCGSTSFRRNL